LASNFDFLKNTDKELFSLIQDAEKLFRDGYFNQCAVQLRIYAEKTAKKVLGEVSPNQTLDDTINCLKDKVKTEREREFVEDLFFIKREGNKCAHGEDALMSDVLEAMRRAFEIAINYAYSKKKDEKINRLQFDETLLITQKPREENPIVEQYIKLAQEEKAELLNSKQGEFNSKTEKTIEGRKDESYVSNAAQYKSPKKRNKKELTPQKQKIKSKIKEARKNLRENINKTPKPKKKTKKAKKQKNKLRKIIIFLIFVTISLFFLTKMIFVF